MSRLIPAVEDAAVWAQQVFGQARLGDARRTRRLVTVAADVASSTGRSLSAVCSSDHARLEGAYRLMRNDEVLAQDIAEAGFARTVADIPDERRTLLAIGDSTTLSYRHGVTEEMGDVGGPKNSSTRGMWVHSVMLMDADSGAIIGLLDQQRWIRNDEERGKKHLRDMRPYEEKESFKWQQSAENVRARLGAGHQQDVVSVEDREADVYQYVCHKIQHGERFIIRAKVDRNVLDEVGQKKQLFSHLKATPACGSLLVKVPQAGSRPARNALLTIRAASERVQRPKRVPTDQPKTIVVNIVMVREERPPKGAEPLEWMLHTTESIAGPNAIERIVKWYSRRWSIEIFHKAWKTGAGVERLRMQSAANIERMAVVLAFAAVRLLQLRDLLGHDGDHRCDMILKPHEWKLLWLLVEKKRLPAKCPPARWAYHALGRLAGWQDTKRSGVVGWETLWDGWHSLQAQLEAQRIIQRLGYAI